MPQTSVDTLVHARWIAPVEPDDRVLEDHAVAIRGGRIEAVLPSAEADSRFSAEQTLHLGEHLLIPGLINAHTHAAMSLMRGLADDLPLMTWLQEHIWPAEQQHVSAAFVRDGTLLACAEMIRSGTTCFNDMYFFPEEAARAADQAGIRAVLGLIVIDFPSAWAQSADDYLHKGLALHDALRGHDRLHTAFAPHAPYSVTDAPLQRIVTLAEELDLPVHMHVHETATEVARAVQEGGRRPIERLDELGLLGPRLLAVHMTQLTEAEVAHCAERGVNVVHCPESNLKLASGFCRAAHLREAGLTVALGTDGAASNNDLDMLGEMRTAALLGKGVAEDASALPAHAVLRMATLDGARALGLDELTGSLLPGKAADMAAIRLDPVETEPVYHPLSQLVYAAGREQVTDVWVAGRQLMRNRELTTLDSADLLARAQRWREKLRENA